MANTSRIVYSKDAEGRDIAHATRDGQDVCRMSAVRAKDALKLESDVRYGAFSERTNSKPIP